jgi:hypothetical protein
MTEAVIEFCCGQLRLQGPAISGKLQLTVFMWLSLKTEDSLRRKENFLSESEMHATELRNEVKSRGIQGTYLTTNEGVDQG